MTSPRFDSKLLEIFPEARGNLRADPPRPMTSAGPRWRSATLRVRFYDTGEETVLIDAPLAIDEDTWLRQLHVISKRAATNPYCLDLHLPDGPRAVYVLAIEDEAAQAALAKWIKTWKRKRKRRGAAA